MKDINLNDLLQPADLAVEGVTAALPAYTPDTNINTSNPKVVGLEARKKAKVTSLSGTFQDDTLLRMNDADSLVTALSLADVEDPMYANGNTRSATDVKYGYDAVEISHERADGSVSDPLAEIKKNKWKRPQLDLVASLMGKTVDEVTSQDVTDVGNMQQIQKLADLSNPEGHGWKAPLIKNSERTNLTGYYKDENGKDLDIPLNVPITSKQIGEGTYRPTYSFGNVDGYDVTKATENDPRLNANYAYAQQASGADAEAVYQKALAELSGDGYLETMAKNTAAGVGAMAADSVDAMFDLGAGIGQRAYEGITGKKVKPEDLKNLGMLGFEVDDNGYVQHKWDYEKGKDAIDSKKAYQNLLGVDNSKVEESAAAYTSTMDEVLKSDLSIKDKAVALVGNALDHIEVVPPLVVDSFVYMKGLMSPKTAVQMLMGATNQHLEERLKNNDGEHANWEEVLATSAGTSAELATDLVASKMTFGIGKGVGAVNKRILGALFGAAEKSSKSMVKTVAVKTMKTIVGAGAIAAEEGLTEAAQEAMGVVIERLHTAGYSDGDIDKMFDEKTMKRIREAGYMGAYIGHGQAVMGKGLNAVGYGAGGVKSVAEARAERVKNKKIAAGTVINNDDDAKAVIDNSLKSISSIPTLEGTKGIGKFQEYDSTKVYNKKDIAGIVENMLLNPEQFDSSDPDYQQFVANNSKSINEIAADMKVKFDKEKLTDTGTAVTKDVVAAINEGTALPGSTVTWLKDVAGITDVEGTISKIKDDKAARGEFMETVKLALNGLERVASSEEVGKEEVLKEVTDDVMSDPTLSANEVKAIRNVVDTIVTRLGSGVKLGVSAWKTAKQVQLDGVVKNDEVDVKEHTPTKAKRLLHLSDENIWDIVVDGDTSSLEHIVGKDGKLETTVVQQLDGYGGVESQASDDLLTHAGQVKELTRKDTGIPLIDGAGDHKARAQAAFRLLATTVNQVGSSIVSSMHEALNEGRTNITFETAEYKVAAQIGKDLLHSYGLTLQGTPKENAKVYTELGEGGIKLATELGLVSKDENYIPNTGNVQSAARNGKRVSAEQLGLSENNEGIKGKVLGIAGTEIVDGVIEFPTFVKSFRKLKPLLNAGNNEVPSRTEFADDHKVLTDKPKLSKVQENAVRRLMKKPLKVKEGIKELMDSWVQDYRTAVDTGVPLVKFIKGHKEIAEFIQLNDYNEKNFLSSSIAGSNWAKIQNIVDTLDNWSKVRDGNLYFEYKVDINERISLLNNVLNFQHDKVAARNMVTSSVDSVISSPEELKFAVNILADDFKSIGGTQQARVNAIMRKGVNADLDAAIEKLDAGFSAGAVVADLIKSKSSLASGVKSGFKLLSMLQAVQDFRHPKDGITTTEYVFHADASASGVMNTLINVIGLSKEGTSEKEGLIAMLKSFGVYFDGAKPLSPDEYKDPYTVVLDKVYSDNEKVVDGRKVVLKQVVADTLNSLKKTGVNLRDIAKYPVMTWFYGQTDANVADGVGKDIALRVFKVAARMEGSVVEQNAAQELIRSVKGLEDVNIHSMVQAEFDILSKHFGTNVGSEIAGTLKALFPQVVRYRLRMNKDVSSGNLFNKLVSIFRGKWKGEFPGAVTLLLNGGKTQPGHNMVVTKNKNVLLDEGNEDSLPLIGYMPVDNPGSLSVNGQHSSDAALEVAGTEVVENGVQTIHDDTGGTVKDMMKNIKEYNENYKKIPVIYDYLDQAYRLLTSFNTEGLSEAALKNFNKFERLLRSEADASLKMKQELITDNTEAEIYGLKEYQTVDIEGVEPTIAEAGTTVEEKADAVLKETTTKYGTLIDELSRGQLGSQLGRVVAALNSGSTLGLSGRTLEVLKNALTDDTHNITTIRSRGVEFKYDVLKEQLVIPEIPNGISDDAVAEILAHELEHDLSAAYITYGQGADIDYLGRVVKKLEKVAGKDATGRVGYILGQRSERAKIAELVAVLRAEPDAAAEISEMLYSKYDKKQGFVKQLFAAIRSVVRKGFKLTKSSRITFRNTAAALEMVRENNRKVGKQYVHNRNKLNKIKRSTSVNTKKGGVNYHVTNEIWDGDDIRLDDSSLGLHVGTVDVVEDYKKQMFKGSGVMYRQVSNSSTLSTLELKDNGADWSVDYMNAQLKKRGIIAESLETFSEIRAALIDKGFDAVVYRNTAEGNKDGNVNSMIVINPNAFASTVGLITKAGSFTNESLTEVIDEVLKCKGQK